MSVLTFHDNKVQRAHEKVCEYIFAPASWLATPEIQAFLGCTINGVFFITKKLSIGKKRVIKPRTEGAPTEARISNSSDFKNCLC